MDVESIPTDGDPLEADLPVVKCPTCNEKCFRQEDLDRHRERHRPLVERTDESVRCPKKCGRWLVPKHVDTESHVVLCDGATPLLDNSEARRRKWYCSEHNFGTDGPKPWGLHKKEFHSGRDPEAPEVQDNVTQAIELLNQEKVRLLQEVDRVESAIKILAPNPGIQV